MTISLIIIFSSLLIHSHTALALYSCQKIYNSTQVKLSSIDDNEVITNSQKLSKNEMSMMNHLSLTPDEQQSTLELLWKLYVDKQILAARIHGNKSTSNDLQINYVHLQQVYSKKLSEAQSKIPDFVNLFEKFKSKISSSKKNQDKSSNASHMQRDRNSMLWEKEELDKKRLDEKKQIVRMDEQLIFHEIFPGSFLLGESSEQIPTKITRRYSLMATLMNQYVWSVIQIVLGERDPKKINPSHFKYGSDSVVINIDGIDVAMQPRHPVEMVSWDTVSQWIDGLNRLSRSDDPKVQDLLRRLIPYHQKGNNYDLPSLAQMEFVQRDLGKITQDFIDGSAPSTSSKHIWHDENANNKTHSVTSLEPRNIYGSDFYHLDGHLAEFLKDRWDGVSELQGGDDPLGIVGDYRLVKGASWFDANFYHRLGARRKILPTSFSNKIGFRLVVTQDVR